MNNKLIAIDASKHIFALHGIDERGHPTPKMIAIRPSMRVVAVKGIAIISG